MGLGRWLQKKGSTGSIARWSGERFKEGREARPDLSESDLCLVILESRYGEGGSMGERLKPDEKLMLDKFLSVGKPRDVTSLAYLIWDVEIGSQLISTPDHGMAQMRQCRDIIDEELERLGVA